MTNTEMAPPGGGRASDPLMTRLKGHFGRWWPTLLMIVLAQVLYWAALRPLLVTPPSNALAALVEPYNARAATLDAPTIDALGRAKFAPVELPWWDCCQGYRAFSADWKLDRVPPEGLGVVAAVDADNVMIVINGHVLHAEGRMNAPHVTHHRQRSILYISPGLVRTGENRIDIIMVRAGLPYFDVGRAPLIAPYPDMVKQYGFRAFQFNEYVYIAITLGFAIALTAFVVMWRSERKAFLAWVGLLSLSWSLLTHFHIWHDPPFNAQWRLNYYFALTNFIPLAWLCLADAWSERRIPWLMPVALAVYVAGTGAAIVAWLTLKQPEGFDLAGQITDYLGIAFSAAAVARFVWHMVRHGDNRPAEIGIFALCITLVFLDRFSELLHQKVGGNLQVMLPILLLALALAYVGRNIRLFQSVNSLNDQLALKVREREAQLAESHTRERELVRRQAHESERQRIMRDMHDGLGSNLMSMLLAARRGNLSPERMAEGIQSVMDEMRLMLESIDSVGQSLPSAITTFRQRIEPRVEAAGMTLSWREADDLNYPRYGPRKVLHVFRILQEAVANALRHSQGQTISVSIEPADGPFAVRMIVADDGKGMRPDAQAGRGLDNMRARAATMGADIAIHSTSTGASIVLQLPVQDPDVLDAQDAA